MNYSYYTYGIDGIEVNKNNVEIVDIQFGNGKMPLQIFKKDVIDFVTAILPLEEIKERGITLGYIAQVIQENGVEALNKLLKGRCMVLLTTFHSYLEYPNGAQNNVEFITNLNIDGQINIRNAFDLKQRGPSYEDLYGSTTGPITKN